MRVPAARASSDQMRLISRRAPTSTPRVGSIMIRMRASAASQRAICTFCWLPPDSVRDLGVDRRRLDLRARRPDPERRRRRAPTSSTPWRTIRSRLAMPILSRDRLLARSGSRGDPAPSARGRAPRHRRAGDRDSAPSTRIAPVAPPGIGAVDRQRGLDAAGAEQPEQPDDLALVRTARSSPSTRCAPSGVEDVEPAYSQARSAEARARSAARLGAPRSPIISATISGRETSARRGAAADAAVAHDDDAVGNGEDLGQAVRHEDDGDAARLQRPHARRTAAATRFRSAPRSARPGSAAAPAWRARER